MVNIFKVSMGHSMQGVEEVLFMEAISNVKVLVDRKILQYDSIWGNLNYLFFRRR